MFAVRDAPYQDYFLGGTGVGDGAEEEVPDVEELVRYADATCEEKDRAVAV